MIINIITDAFRNPLQPSVAHAERLRMEGEYKLTA